MPALKPFQAPDSEAKGKRWTLKRDIWPIREPWITWKSWAFDAALELIAASGTFWLSDWVLKPPAAYANDGRSTPRAWRSALIQRFRAFSTEETLRLDGAMALKGLDIQLAGWCELPWLTVTGLEKTQFQHLV
jgi:hypothetical protein